VTLGEHEVGGRDVMLRIDVTGQGSERPIRQPHGDRRCVFERIRHRQQQDLNEGPPENVTAGTWISCAD
jgi:hypothetical protein